MQKVTTKSQTLIVKNQRLTMISPNVAGIDIGANSVFVCAGFADGVQQVREFSTFTADLKAMANWLKKCGNKSVAMESTGVYWIAPFDILAEAGFDVLLVNPRTIKAINRKKTDVMDCQWIQELHSYGLLKGSFRPDDHGVAFRGYVRQRSRLIKDAAIQIQLMHKALTQMNIQLRQVLSDITGMTGLAIIRAIVDGENDPKVLAQHRHSNCRRKEDEIIKALEGNFRTELIFALQQALEAYDFFQRQITACDKKIKEFIENWRDKNDYSIAGPEESFHDLEDNDIDAQQLTSKLVAILGVDLTKIPGLSNNLLMQIISETGTDMTRWPSSKHFASWLGLCPENKISGGKVLDNKTRPVANKAAQALRLAARTLYRSKTCIGEFLRRMRGRLGAPKAITATAHKLAIVMYTMITEKKQFTEFGQDAYEQRHKDRAISKLKRKAAELGYELVKESITKVVVV
jgi:transposase